MLPQLDEKYFSLKDVEVDLKKCNCIKYAAYRTAAKLRVIQKALHMDKVSLKVVSNVFEMHHLQQTENSVQLDQKEVDSVLSDIYFVVKKENDISFNTDYLSELMFQVLLNIYDKKMSNSLQVLSFKIGLTLLCQGKPREKYHYLFEQLADHNNCLSRRKLEILLRKMISLTEHLGERLSFGSELIQGTVESCFSNNIGSLGISEDVFMSWLMQDPQLLVWLSTFYRMQISESVSHNAKCAFCKICPLVGLRYRCLRCLSFDMCQSCFFTGKHNKKHKLKHPVQEYCCPMTSQQSTKAFLITLRNRLYRKDCQLQYLPALKVDMCSAEALGNSTGLLDEMEVSCRTVVNGSRISLHRFSYRELQSIIVHLERESAKIIPDIDNFCSGMEGWEATEYKTHLKNCLMKHKAQIQAQMQRLSLMRNYLTRENFAAKAFLASTPLVDETVAKYQKKDLRADLENFSPITVRSFRRREKADCGIKMMWDNYNMAAFAVSIDVTVRGNCGANPSWEEVQSAQGGTDSSEAAQENLLSVPEQKTLKADDSELELSTLLGRKSLRELESSSREGFSWLLQNEKGEPEEEEEGLREEKEETFDELQSDLKRILSKLQELSVVTCRGEGAEEGGSEIMPEKKKNVEIDVIAEVDLLLADLISGMEKLIRI